MPFNDIIVAVHGIGKQSRFSTVRSVATQLANSQALSGTGKVRPVAPQPLGYFHSDVRSVTSVRLVDDAESLKDSDLKSVGFAEVFWADIPQEVAKEGRTLEETKAWARTVVARAQALCERAKKDPNRNWIVPPDFSLAGEVLDEIIETVYVLENLTFIAEKAGLFKFDLREVLEDYLGDVQLVTEFSYYRTDVVGRFHEAMRSINEQHPNAHLHIVAHSEGSVVSFLGLLHAMCGRKLHPADAQKGQDAKIEETKEIPAWLKQVRGFMTIGSPIDKHLLLWWRLWENFDAALAKRSLPAGQIRWRNYYDYGDPVGFKLDSARLWLAKKEIRTFEFCGCKDCRHDMGFARYLLPGAAHNEYWNDSDVFEHFISNVVKTPFSVADLKDASSLVKKLKEHSDGVSTHLFERFSTDVPGLLSTPEPASQDVVDELNRLVQGPPASLYQSSMTGDISPFAAVLSQEGKDLLAKNPAGPSLVALNRILLEDAYPKEIAKNTKKVPRTKPLIAILSAVLPFLGSFILLMLGVFVLFKAVYAYSHPSLDPLQRFVRFQELGVKPATGLHGWGFFSAVVGIAALIAGATLLARFRRLALGKSWIFAGFAALLVGFGFYAGLVPEEIRSEIGGRFWYLGGSVGSWAPTLGILAVTAIAGMSGFLAMSRSLENADRRQRWFMRGMRPLMVCGAVAIGLVILSQLFPRNITRLWSNGIPIFSFSSNEIALIRSARLTPDELKQMITANPTNWVNTVRSVEPVLATNSPIWPVVLAGAAFLYLWWLATLTFDLAFVWHRYIRNSTTNDRLREWNPHGFTPYWDRKKGEKCCNPAISSATRSNS